MDFCLYFFNYILCFKLLPILVPLLTASLYICPWQEETSLMKWCCSVCNRPFSTHAVLRRHIRTVHSATCTLHACRMCGRSFNRKDNLLAHLAKSHPGFREQMSELHAPKYMTWICRQMLLYQLLEQFGLWNMDRHWSCVNCIRLYSIQFFFVI